MDEMRGGQHGTLTRKWGLTGKRALAPKQMEFGNLHMYGAACCGDGRSLGMLSTHVGIDSMNDFLEEFGKQLKPGEHALLLMDKAPYHTSAKLKVPPNVTLIELPPCSPELNPAELLWREMRMKRLANRVFKTMEEVDEAMTESWKELVSDANRLQSLCGFGWILGAAPA